MKFILPLFLLIASPVFAAEAVINGPTAVSLDELIILDGTGSTGSATKWIVDPTFDSPFLEAQGKFVTQIKESGSYTFILVSADTDGISYTHHKVTVADRVKTPEPKVEKPFEKPPTPPPVVKTIPSRPTVIMYTTVNCEPCKVWKSTVLPKLSPSYSYKEVPQAKKTSTGLTITAYPTFEIRYRDYKPVVIQGSPTADDLDKIVGNMR